MILQTRRNFLKVSDIQGGEIITFVNEGEWLESKKFTNSDGTPRKDFVIKVKLAGEEKDMRLNATNRQILISAFGNDTAKWIGKFATLSKEKVIVAGRKLDTIVVEPQDRNYFLKTETTSQEDEPAL